MFVSRDGGALAVLTQQMADMVYEYAAELCWLYIGHR
jgi:hypothetical protein